MYSPGPQESPGQRRGGSSSLSSSRTSPSMEAPRSNHPVARAMEKARSADWSQAETHQTKEHRHQADDDPARHLGTPETAGVLEGDRFCLPLPRACKGKASDDSALQ